MENSQGRLCPICKSPNKNILSRLTGDYSILSKSFPATQIDNVSCVNCGTVYVDSFATQSDFSNYYENFSSPFHYEVMFGLDTMLSYFEYIYDAIKPYLSLNSRILDLGCGSGEFAKFLLDLGYSNTIAADCSEQCIRLAKTKGVSAFKLNIVGQEFLDECEQTWFNSFDLIIISHTLEHLIDVNLALSNLNILLKPDGHMYIEVPDACRYSSVDICPFFFTTYEHLIHFSPFTFDNIGRFMGFNIIKTKSYLKCSRYYVLYAIFSKYNSTKPLLRDASSENLFNSYIERCNFTLSQAINNLIISSNHYILWGIGSSTVQLLTDSFSNLNILMLVDSNPCRQGLVFKIGEKKYVVQAPEAIQDSSATILILPYMFKDVIIGQALSMKLSNAIISLF